MEIQQLAPKEYHVLTFAQQHSEDCGRIPPFGAFQERFPQVPSEGILSGIESLIAMGLLVQSTDGVYLAGSTPPVKDAPVRKPTRQRRRHPSKRNTLSSRQGEVMQIIAKHVGETGRFPTYRTVSEICGFASQNSVTQVYKALEKKGLIFKDEGEWRLRRLN